MITLTTFLSVVLTAAFFFVCVLLVLIVLLQPSHGEGLGSAFGGGISESFFGTRAMTWLARATIAIALLFLVLAIALNKMPRGKSDSSVITPPAASQEAAPKPAPPEKAPPAPEAPPTPKTP
jgi:preprotein translocase subunit SecG